MAERKPKTKGKYRHTSWKGELSPPLDPLARKSIENTNFFKSNLPPFNEGAKATRQILLTPNKWRFNKLLIRNKGHKLNNWQSTVNKLSMWRTKFMNTWLCCWNVGWGKLTSIWRSLWLEEGTVQGRYQSDAGQSRSNISGQIKVKHEEMNSDPSVPWLAYTFWQTSRRRRQRVGNKTNSCTRQSTNCVEIVKLDANRSPLDQLWSHCMLPKGLVIGHPNATTELTMSTEDQKLVLAKIFPSMRKIQHQGQAMNWCAFIHIVMSSIYMALGFLRCRRKDHTVIKQQILRLRLRQAQQLPQIHKFTGYNLVITNLAGIGEQLDQPQRIAEPKEGQKGGYS